MSDNLPVKQLAADLQAAYAEMMRVLSVFDDRQLNELPFEGSWTAGQVVDHILQSTAALPDNHTVPARRRPDEKVKGLSDAFLNFDTKFKSPDFILPGSGPFSVELQLATLQQFSDKHQQKIAQGGLEELCSDFELPVIGALTRFEWLSFFVVHIIRHTHQLKNIARHLKLQEA